MEALELEMNGPVAWVWLDRPQRMNALDEQALLELRDTFAFLHADDAVRAIVVAGRGPVFSAGFDVRWMATLDASTVHNELSRAREVYDTIETCAKPVIAAVQGPAIGGGLLLTLAADFRIAAEGATFGAPEVMIGIFPSLDLIPRLERIVGLGAAKRMVMTGEPVTTANAKQMGLVDQVLTPERLHDAARALGGQLAALPPMGVRAAKEAFAASRRSGYASWETEAFADCWASPDREAAMRVFLQTD
ncbi:MAG: enoyl-CoA hydratase/isomerase family protein [Actinomycetota bacterium]